MLDTMFLDSIVAIDRLQIGLNFRNCGFQK